MQGVIHWFSWLTQSVSLSSCQTIQALSLFIPGSVFIVMRGICTIMVEGWFAEGYSIVDILYRYCTVDSRVDSTVESFTLGGQDCDELGRAALGEMSRLYTIQYCTVWYSTSLHHLYWVEMLQLRLHWWTLGLSRGIHFTGGVIFPAPSWRSKLCGSRVGHAVVRWRLQLCAPPGPRWGIKFHIHVWKISAIFSNIFAGASRREEGASYELKYEMTLIAQSTVSYSLLYCTVQCSITCIIIVQSWSCSSLHANCTAQCSMIRYDYCTKVQYSTVLCTVVARRAWSHLSSLSYDTALFLWPPCI